DPTVVIGGELNDIGSNAKVGEGPHFVAEADESDRSFLRLSPSIAVVTNVEAEHLENYAGLEDIKAAFRAFLAKLPKDGLAVVCGDDANARAAAPDHCRVVTYGLGEGHDYTAADVELFPMGSRAVVREQGAPLGIMVLRVPGLHNIANALAAVAVGRALNLPFGVIAQALGAFRGAKRRLEVLGEVRDVLIIDDYAHHPTEIRATLAALRNMERRVVAVFQPHRYTRTKHLMDELAASFEDADAVVLTDIYAALEAPIPGVDVEVLARRVRAASGKPVAVVRDLDAVPGYLLAAVRPGDLVVTLGAGDVRRAGEGLLSLLAAAPAMAAHLTPPDRTDPGPVRD
ncbi:MAG: cyanophycin synthetase, partial [Limnochordales bacterium]